MTRDGDGPRGGRGVGTAVSTTVPRILAGTLGPILRRTTRGDPAFLDRLSRTHTESMLGLPDDHWDRLIGELGLRGHRAVLEVGCGAGAWLPRLALVNERVLGTDIDDEALEIARERSSAADNVEIRKMAAEQLGFPAESFDAVACLTVLPYIDQPVALGEIARVLTPGGRLVLGTMGAGYYAKHVAEGIRRSRVDVIRYGLDPMLVAASRTVAGSRIAPASLRSWSPRAVRRLAERQGLGVDRIFRNVDAADPTWPRSYLGRPMYFIAVATKRPA